MQGRDGRLAIGEGSELAIGTVRIAGRALLAPMSGISDLPLRQLAARWGAPLVISEMVASDRLVAGESQARLRLEGQGLACHAVQLAGCGADELGEAARIAEGAGAHIIDINMGCPAKRVVGGWAGSALMRDVVHAAALIAAVVGAVKVPVTVKMRLGFDRTMKNAPELARLAEDAGAAMVTVHGRTRCQRYQGRADWAAIAATRAAVTIPVVANGDIGSAEDACRARAASGASAVMIGRAALGRPWLVGAIAAELSGQPRSGPPIPATAEELGELAVEHSELLLAYAGSELGLRFARKHVAAYADQLSDPPGALRHAALTAASPAAARAAIRTLFAAAPLRVTLGSSVVGVPSNADREEGCGTVAEAA